MYKRTRWGFTILALIMAFGVYLIYDPDPTDDRESILLGIDLQGGTELTYVLDLSRVDRDRAEVVREIKDIIGKRLNAYGLKELSISTQGQDQLVIQLPGTSDSQSVAHLKRQIETAGNLSFRLVSGQEHQAPDRQEQYQREWETYLEEDREWIQNSRSDPNFNEMRPEPPQYIVRQEVEKVKRRGPTGKTIEEWQPTGRAYTLDNRHDYINETKEWEAATAVSGSFLSRVSRSVDPDTFKPAVAFEFNGEGARRFGSLTGANIKGQLAIVLDDDVMQVATIQSRITTRGQLTGDFSDEDVKGIITILRGGSLETTPTLVSENTVGSVLGRDSIGRSLNAIVLALIVVMIIMSVYYLAGGLVANFAVALNVFFILAFVACFRQTLTLPGIAGILLTVGMAVDANILIFERVREERKRGKSLLHSLQAGYRQAFRVIFDANLTTLITGFVLFKLGTGPVKGFSVTLISGIIISFFTAIFVTRLVISALLNVGLLKEFKMLQAFDTPRVPFVRYQRFFLTGSIALVLLSWCLVFYRGTDNYGIDFTGGGRLHVKLNKPVAIQKMKDVVAEVARDNPEYFRDYSLQTLHTAGGGQADEFSLRTRLPKNDNVARAQEPPKEPAKEPAEPAKEPAGSADAETPAGGTPAAQPQGEAQPATPPTPEVPPTTPAPTAPTTPAEGATPPAPVVAPADGTGAPATREHRQADRVRQLLEDALRKEGLLLPAPFPLAGEASSIGEWKSATAADAAKAPEKVRAGEEYLVFEANFTTFNLTSERLQTAINEILKKEHVPDLLTEGGFLGVEVINVDLVRESTPENPVTAYRFTTSSFKPAAPGVGAADRTVPTREQVEDTLRRFFHREAGSTAEAAGGTQTPEQLFELAEPFPQVDTVGGRVADNLQMNALVAIFISMLGIIFYISLRFEFIFGLAAIAALIHDVMLSIGLVAVTDHFFRGFFPVKINLTELAAILTIIGYSINDTIVVFDRIRENIQGFGKRKFTFADVVDLSINQTLTRTLWTSVTTLLVTVALLAFATEAVRGFAFIFALGVVTGTYSSVFVASPILIWLQHRAVLRREAIAAEAAA